MTKSYKEIKKEKEGTDVQVEACWSGYKQVGMKKKGNRQVPNCVPESVVNALFGKDYIYEVSESVADMYKGTVTPAQLTKMKQLWKTKKASDVTPAVKNFVKGLDQFTQMDIKKANIKYISDLIEEFEEGEVDLVNESKEIFQESEMRVLVRRNEMTEGYFSADQLNRLAKAYSVMKDRTISVSNAKKLGDMINRLPDHALNDVRKKKIPFISGLALSRMIQRKIPVTESVYLDEARWHVEGNVEYRGIRSGDDFDMVIDAPNEKAAEEKAEKELEKARDRRKIGPGGGGSIENIDFHQIERTNDKLQGPETFPMGNSFDPQLKEADLSKSQIKKVHKQADDLPKKDFMKRYGKDGDSVRYATATNMVKKKLGLGESNFIKKGELKMNDTYKQRLTSAMEHFNISSLGELNEDDHKTFFSYVDDMKEGLSAAQKKLPPALQKAIAKKMKDKSEMHDMKKDKEMKEDLNEKKADFLRLNFANNQTVKKAERWLYNNLGHSNPGYTSIIADKNSIEFQDMNDADSVMTKLKRAGFSFKVDMREDLVGGQKKLDKDKDGDLDAKDFAMLRKKEGSMKKEYGMSMKASYHNKMKKEEKTKETDSEPKMKDLNAMVKSSHKPDHKGNPIDDMNAGYMKSNVKAPVKDGGGADMAKVKDAPKMMTAMMKISSDKKMKNMKAMYGEEKKYLKTKPGSLEEAVLVSRGLIKK